MKLARIKDGYMFRTENPNGEHTYALFYDKKAKAYRAVQTTHLYRRDEKRFKQLEKGALMKVKFPNSDVPSAVRSYHYTHNANGEKIDIKHNDVQFVSKKHLPKWMSDKIKAFSVDKYVTKKRPLTKKKSR